MAAADPAKTIPFRDRFAKVAFNAFAITRPIYDFQGCETIVRRNMRLGRTLPISRGSGTVPGFSIIRLERLDQLCLCSRRQIELTYDP
jgi:hypothetical protein